MITNSYDSAGRAVQVAGVLGTQRTNYVSNAAYLPHGAPYHYMYGNSIWPTFLYNNRLQPDQFYGLLNNNGNLRQVDELVGNAVPWVSLTPFNQTFTYDNVNRLKTASDSGGWSQTYSTMPGAT